MKLRTILALGMVAVLALVLMACGNNETPAETPPPEATPSEPATQDETNQENEQETGQEGEVIAFEDVVTLRVFSMTSNTSGLMEHRYWTSILEEEFGIKLELMPAGDQAEQRLALLMAGGDFPDLVGLSTHMQVRDAIAAGHLLELSQHEASLPDVFANIPGGIRFYRDNVSSDSGGLYALPTLVSTQGMEVGDVGFMPTVRWDHYEALGSPEINTWEDLIPLIADLTEMNPYNDYGQRVFGYGLFADWDYHGLWMSNLLMNIYGVQNYGFLEVNFADNSFTSMFDDNSVYKRFLDFAFTLNQMGLVDPDSVTQRFEDWWGKLEAGRYAFSEGTWVMGMFNTEERTAQGIGYMPLFVNDMMVEQTTGPNFIGHEGGWSWAISANTQHVERALAYTNFMYSHDGILRMRYGNPGPDMFWNLDANGMPYRTEASFDPDFTFADGSIPDEGISTLNNNGLMPREIHPGFGVTIDASGWQVMPWAPQLDPLRQSWNSIMGVDDRGTIAWLRERGNLIERDFAPTLPLSEEMSSLESRIADFTRTLSWQMIFARDQAEFDSLWREMVDRAEAMGVEEANAERAQLHMDALEFGANYMP